jgi:hypothetical protein
MLSGDALERAIEEARNHARSSPFKFEFRLKGLSSVLVTASGQAAGKSFGSKARLTPVADVRQLVQTVDDLTERLRVVGDRFHRGLPYPIRTSSEEKRLGALGQVDLAIDEFVGVRLRGIALEETLFLRFLLERGLFHEPLEPIVHRGIPVVIGGTGVTYLFDD